MTGGEVEFLGGEPEPAPPRRVAAAVRRVPVIGWLLASGLAVAAPFLPVYTQFTARRYADYQGLAAHGPDGWGRPLGVDFGIPLVVCAAGFAVLVGLAVLNRSRVRHGAAAPGAALDRVAIAAPCLLAGVVAVLALYVAEATGPAEFGWFAYAPLNSGSSTYGSSLSISGRTSPGWCLWLAVAALTCGVAATAVHLAAERHPRRTGDLAG